ncbi:5-deoxy-glucuronate isomerase [Paenibacillus sp. 7541]|uniref:5-deoxy-glucuronate isomerase n=1 Tax=Paenibacillus sp. 7541 TaxID=2026236 RepID=UPI000BA711BC|nr:5-deoxy-glucuronate isomerase [Paenibacillus sp. 7541]PAK55201.1 5-deoxy-glucuronate isomerase [Paenibacillus sp. 7541]
MQSKLIVPEASQPNQEGVVLRVTPESAGWSYVGYEMVKLKKGEALMRETGRLEACLVFLSGKGDVRTAEKRWTGIGQRMSVFEKTPPYSVYVPSEDRYEVVAETDVDLAVCTAPGGGEYEARLIEPGHVGVEHRGSGNMARLVHNILPESEPAHSLLVVEVFTPGGHWSSYPPHKHDRDALPEESLLEETYYYRIQPEQGFAVQRVYTDDGSLDETLCVRNGQAVLVPKGYHPVAAPAGYEVYYLNVMAGPRRTWKFYNDPHHEWLLK